MTPANMRERMRLERSFLPLSLSISHQQTRKPVAMQAPYVLRCRKPISMRSGNIR